MAARAMPQPSCRQTTWASGKSQSSSQTVPQVPRCRTSTRPRQLPFPFASRKPPPAWRDAEGTRAPQGVRWPLLSLRGCGVSPCFLGLPLGTWAQLPGDVGQTHLGVG